ncbi:hypothetical protein JXJ21_15860 [candidate division KSB1 bacterium]|nr:hypothetical protein [candidate division KSB1 bacterium]
MSGQKYLFGRWDEFWGRYKDLRALNNAYDHLDIIFREIESSSGEILLSTDMCDIQEELINRIEKLTSNQLIHPASLPPISS